MKISFNELISIYFNLLKTTMGCGILNYPLMMKEFGIIQCILFTFISALSSYAGIVLYIDLNAKYGNKSTLSTITRHFQPSLKYVADIVVIFKCYTVAIAYLVYIKDQLDFLINHYNLNINLYMAFLGIVILISPFVFMTKLDKLKYTSILGIAAIFLLISTSYYRFIQNTNIHKIVLFRKSNQYLQSLSYFVFSFTCHQNIFTLQNEMRNCSAKSLKITALLSFLSASCIYLVFGIVSYLAFGNNLQKPFINSHPVKTKVPLSWFYIILLGLSVPLQTNPVKQYSLNMINEKYLKDPKYALVRFWASFLILGSCFGLACTNVDFDSMCKLIGATFSTCMCFLFASLYYFLSFKVINSKFNTLLALVSLSYGTLTLFSVFK